MSAKSSKRMSVRTGFLGSSAIVLLLAAPALAEDYEWTGAISNDWFTAGNWDVGGVPSTREPHNNDNAYVDSASVSPVLPATRGTEYLNQLVVGNTGTGAMTAYASINGNQVVLGSTATGNGTLTMSGSGAEMNLPVQLVVGGSGTGTLNMEAGASSNIQSGIVGNAAGSTGTVNISGSGSILKFWGADANGLYVGNAGTGTITVTNGGKLESNDAWIGQAATGNGTIVISGSGSEWNGYGDVVLGLSGTGTVRVESGAKANNTNLTIGAASGSNGNAVLTGAGSEWNVYDTIALGGAGGTGSLSVLDGATMNSSNLLVGQAETGSGTATVSGSGSKLQLSATLRAGVSGTGEIDVTSGGSITADHSILGVNATGDGTLSISGSGSSVTLTNRMTVAALGTGELDIAGGGRLQSNGGIIGRDAGSNGTALITSGGTWENTSNLTVGADGTGEMSITNGGIVNNHTTVLGDGATGTGTVTVSDAGSIWTIDGGLTVAASGTGTLAIEDGGKVISTASTVAAAAGSTGAVSVSGSSSLWDINGDLVVGAGGNGTLTLANGGVVSTDSLALASGSGSTGTLNIGAALGDAATAAGTLDSTTINLGAGGGTIVFNHTDSDYLFSSVISGTGSIIVANGNTVLTADNTNNGTTAILSGASLQIGNGGTTGTLGGDVAVSGTLAFARSDDFDFRGTISGDGTLVKEGDGDLTLTADSSAFSGAANVNAGALLVDGDLRGATIDVASGAAVGGSGTIGDTLIRTGGFFRSGDENGSITVDGDLDFEAAATYVAVINAVQEPAVVTGEVAFDDTTIALDFDKGGVLKKSYTLLTANEISGSFQQEAGDLPSQFRGTLSEEDNNLYLSLAYVGGDFHFSRLGYGVNQQLVKAFNDGVPLYGTLSAGMLQEGQAYEAAMTTLGGELGINGTMTASIGMQDFLQRATNPSRLLAGWRAIEREEKDTAAQKKGNALPSAGSVPALSYWTVGNTARYDYSTPGRQPVRWDWAYAGRGSLLGPFNPRNAAWLEYSGQTASVDGDAAAGNSGADIRGNSFEGGYLARLDDTNAVGFVFGGGSSTYDQTDQDGKATDQGLRAAINAVGQTKEGIYGLAALGVGFDSMETERTVAFEDAVDRLKGDYNTTTVGARLEAGGRIVNGGLAVIPFAGASIVYTHAPGYREDVVSGTGQSALAYSGADIFRGTVEAGLGFDTAAGDYARRFSLNSRVSYVYRYGSGGDASASFLSLPGYGFTITSNAPKGSAVAANVGARIQLSTQTDLSLNAYGEWGSGYSALVASAKLRYIW
ncbi:autotransporter domain-containing protein [Martelella endophytica]|uniref:Autotransporter domain-containing protein n=1 Tax=Martelella endophytica TaxID=1486262 RepID=A0A0D5LRY8_MAREN|nr:autotransporter domain-containing protein [Martelella endophytica]AJY46944.1 hypothetical protein TM49_16650 [Martelella endophytica]